MKIKHHTVNVIEQLEDGGVLGLHAFTECRRGNKRAEKLFRVLVKEHESSYPDDIKSPKEEIDACIEDGTYERGNYNYRLLLVHST